MERFSQFFVNRWQFTLALFGMLFTLGIASLLSIPKAEDPEVDIPASGVVVILPGADAEQMERVVAIPIEQALNSLENVKEINSQSEANVSLINIEFNWGEDPEKKYDEVVRELNRVRPDLPDGVALIRVDRRNPGSSEPRSDGAGERRGELSPDGSLCPRASRRDRAC